MEAGAGNSILDFETLFLDFRKIPNGSGLLEREREKERVSVYVCVFACVFVFVYVCVCVYVCG